MISYKSFKSEKNGIHILVLGAIHGDEICGPNAIHALIDEISSGKLKLLKGTVTCVPICNPKAYELNKRFFEENLARCFYKKDVTGSYEQQLAQELITIIEKSDIILDLHSMGAQGKPFVFQDYLEDEYEKLAKSTGLSLVVQGRPEIYQAKKQQDVSGYANSIGIPCIVVECGQDISEQDNIDSTNIAIKVINNVLKTYNLIEGYPKVGNDFEISLMKKLYLKHKPGSFTKKRKHGDKVREGEIIINYEDGSCLAAKEDSIIILPKHGDRKIGDEWFYLGVGKEG